jgi:hypothetical protein
MKLAHVAFWRILAIIGRAVRSEPTLAARNDHWTEVRFTPSAVNPGIVRRTSHSSFAPAAGAVGRNLVRSIERLASMPLCLIKQSSRYRPRRPHLSHSTLRRLELADQIAEKIARSRGHHRPFIRRPHRRGRESMVASSRRAFWPS